MDAGAVRERAVELVDALNALGWHADPGFEPVSIGGVIGDDALVAVGIRWHAQHDLGGALRGPVRASTRRPSPPGDSMSRWHVPSTSSMVWGPASSSVRLSGRTKVQPGSAWCGRE
jgi:hypothetical protein